MEKIHVKTFTDEEEKKGFWQEEIDAVRLRRQKLGLEEKKGS